MLKIVRALSPAFNSFIRINTFHFLSTPNKLFKKQQKPIKPKTTSMQKNFQDTSNGADSILEDYQRYFKEQRALLPTYLRRVCKTMSKQGMSVKRQKLQLIYYELNRCSSQLVLKSHQYLQILIFIDKYLSLSQSPLDQTVNNGFQHRATMLAATFLLNREFTITQAIAIFQILTRIGCVSMLFLVNLTKFLKLQFQSQRAQENMRIEHILIILNTYYIKNNHTILQNVLYDITLHYLLQHNQLTKLLPNGLKVQLICLLIRLDLRYFYQSEESDLTFLIKRLIEQLKIDIKRFNINTTLQKHLQYKQNEINMSQIIYLAQSYEFATRYHQSRLFSTKIRQLVQQLGHGIVGQIRLQQNKDININLLMRILVNRHLAIEMQLKEIKAVLQRCESIQQSMFYPVVDKYYESQGQEKDKIILFINMIWQIIIEKGLFIPSIVKIVIENGNAANFVTQIKQIKINDGGANQLFFYILLIFAKIKHPFITNQTFFTALQRKFSHKIQKLAEDKILFVGYVHQAIHRFRDIQFTFCWLPKVNVNWTNYSKITHPSLLIRDSHEVKFICITSLLLSNNSQFSYPTFKQHNLYSYLLLLYPQNHPKPNQYNKGHNFLSIDHSFQTNIRIVDRLVGNLDKYYYLIWDIFINNYAQRSATVRKDCFGLVKHFFLRAYQKQSARKVVLLTTFTNYISSGVILASQSQLQQMVEMCLQPLVDSKVKDKFHYHCFLQITFNCRAANILSNEYFTKIIIRWLTPQSSDPKSFKVSTLMLLYGHTLKNTPQNYYLRYYEQQRKYIKDLLNKKLVRIANNEITEKIDKSYKVVSAGTKFMCILLEFGQAQLLPYLPQMVNFIQRCFSCRQFMQLIYSFKPSNYDKANKLIKEMTLKLNKAFLEQVQSLHKHSLIEKEHYQGIINQLIANEAFINDTL